ncbi:MAG: hypothetical protein PHC61_18960, partial [Chitinivibrionales bacterium]|nr:hypothetical protein [Chitinivibrionales bacterium]
MNRPHIYVVMGGPSAEHEISLRSGRCVLKNLDRARYDISALVITDKKEFYCSPVNAAIPEIADLKDPG